MRSTADIPATIYKIVHVPSNRCYVGHTTRPVKERWAGHLRRLRRRDHHSPYLQAAWNKYGLAEFDFVVIEECPRDRRIQREQHWIDTLDSVFNAAKIASIGHPVGIPQSAESNAKRSASQTGKKRTPEQRARMSAAQKGKPHLAARGKARSAETRAKISAVTKGRKGSHGHTGHRHSEETKAQIAAKKRGHKTGMTGKQHSAEANAKNRQSQLGKKHSEATRAKMRASHAARLARLNAACDTVAPLD